MPERALVHDAAARQGPDRAVAAGVQRGAAEAVAGRADPGRLCKAAGPENG